MRYVLAIALLCVACVTAAEPRQVDAYTWEGVERIVAIGDLHGDYDHYIDTLRAAELVNKRGKWTGGAAHLVQTGDIPDRGPDTREIMEHIDKLARQAASDGGRVHLLIGNHEAMNSYGDLRYVTPQEFADFAGRNSEAMVDRYYELSLEDMKANNPEQFAALPEDYREQWDKTHPPGFVEHRQAWDPAWNPEGEYALRTLELKAAVKINGTVFVHGGISDKYADLSLEELSRQAHAELTEFNYENPGLVADECGPLWFRGLSGREPEVGTPLLESILERLSAQRIVVGHTPTPGVVWPRYNTRVVQIDTGIAAHYGGRPAYLEITADGLVAGYPGGKVALPASDDERGEYLTDVIALQPENSALKRFREQYEQPVEASEGAPGDLPAEAAEGEEEINLCLKDAA